MRPKSQRFPFPSSKHSGHRDHLVTIDKIFPFTFALIGTATKALLLHLPCNKLPESLVALRLREVLLKLGSNGNKLFGFMVTPLRNAILFLASAAWGERAHVSVVDILRRVERDNRQRA